jgi:hypothetical protein
MSDEDKARLELEQQIQAAQSELARVQLSLDTNLKSPPTAIPHLPTPMAQTVFTREEHFRLLGGRLVYVPFSEMVERMQADAPSKVHRLKNVPRIEEVLPERLWLVEADQNLGEPLESALAAGSQFRARLTGLDRERTVITVWVYPDSFAEFRTLKGELFKAGFLTAARPLPDGVPIGGAPDGSRSSAE